MLGEVAEEIPKKKLAIPEKKEGPGLGVHCRKNIKRTVSGFLNGEIEQVEGQSGQALTRSCNLCLSYSPSCCDGRHLTTFRENKKDEILSLMFDPSLAFSLDHHHSHAS